MESKSLCSHSCLTAILNLDPCVISWWLYSQSYNINLLFPITVFDPMDALCVFFVFIFPLKAVLIQIRPRRFKTWVQSQTQNKAQWLAACVHVSASSQSLRFILSLRINSSFITSRPGSLCCYSLLRINAVSHSHNESLLTLRQQPKTDWLS